MIKNAKIYQLTGNRTPPTFVLASASTRNKDLSYYDKKKNERREMLYADNQKSFFVDEQNGTVRMSHIIFENGDLMVPNEYPTKIAFLEHHPDNVANGGTYFFEVNPALEAGAIIEEIDIVTDALVLARSLGPDELIAVLRKTHPNSNPESMESWEIKRDIKIFAKNNPKKFIAIADSVETVEDDMVARAFEEGVLAWRKNGTEVFRNYPDAKTRLFVIPEDENPMESLKFFLKTNAGLEDYKRIEDLLSEND